MILIKMTHRYIEWIFGSKTATWPLSSGEITISLSTTSRKFILMNVGFNTYMMRRMHNKILLVLLLRIATLSAKISVRLCSLCGVGGETLGMPSLTEHLGQRICDGIARGESR